MKRNPIRAEDPIINSKRWLSIGFYALIISAASLGAVFLSHILLHSSESWNPELCNNILFFTLIFSQLFHVFNMGQSGTNFFKSEVFRNKYVWAAIACCLLILLGVYLIVPLRNVLSIFPMSLYDLMISLGLASVGTLIIQLAKTLKIVGQ